MFSQSFKLKLQSFVLQLFHLKPPQPFREIRNGSYLAVPCTVGPLVLVFPVSLVPLLEDQAVQAVWVLWILADCVKTWAPVPVGSATVADAFFVELLNKFLDRKSCSEIAQPPALSSGKVLKITIFYN